MYSIVFLRCFFVLLVKAAMFLPTNENSIHRADMMCLDNVNDVVFAAGEVDVRRAW